MNNEIEAIKAIKVELDKIKESGSLSDFFSILKKGLLPSGKTIKKEHRYMAFLLCIDAISQKLYSKDSENGYYAIELSKYTNGETGYFDLLFKHASLLIRDLILEEIEMSPEKDVKFKDYKMNVILKMDTHNNPQGKSKYSLITNAGDFFITDENCNSLAYTLFFDYSLFCNSKKDNKELTDDEIYTVHKEFLNEKTARSFAYQFEESNLIKYIDGNKEVETNYDLNKGEKHYKDFISYILNEELIEKDDSDFSRYLRDSNTDNSWKKGKSLSSFSYYNLGIPGFESWGTLMIECNKDVQTVYEKFYRRGGENDDTLLLSQIKNVISALKKIDDEYNDALNKQRIRRESEKSAKAAIMSRNMSHNIGSHVMSYLKQHLSSVKDMLNDRVLSELYEGETGFKHEKPAKATLPFLVGLGHFISYLQERQDFIATIATDYIPYFSTVNFKDFIYDELNPDKRAERHSEWMSYLKMDNILLGNIARSEGLGRPTRPTIGYDPIKEKEKGSVLSDIILKFGNKFNGSLPAKGSTEEKELDFMRTIDVSLPGGIVGRQAIFSIVENIIRNAAKHGNWRKQGKLELSFNVYTKEDFELSENQSRIPSEDNEEGCLSLRDVLNNFYINAKDSDNLYFVTITDNCDFSLESLGKLRHALLDDYIDETGMMLNGNKGLKEIRISAAWLRAIKEENDCYCPYPAEIIKKKHCIDSKQLELDGEWKHNDGKANSPIVYARISATKGKKTGKISKRNLQYIICLSIPRKVAIISNTNDFMPYKDFLHRKNWRIYSVDEFIKEKNKSFEFILCDDEKDKIVYSEIRPIATSRICSLLKGSKTGLNIDKDGLIKNLKSKDFDAGKYELLLYKYLSDYQEGDFISIDDKSAKEKYENKQKKDGKSTGILQIVIDKTNTKFVSVKNDKEEWEECLKIDVDENNVEHIFTRNKDGEWEKCHDTNNRVYQNIKEYNFTEGTYYKVGKVLVADSHCCGNYIYRKHNETVGEFSNFMQSKPNFNGYVEGITGSNSTDRIIRNEEIDDLWFYRNLHAMKSQVAIFDERIFAKITGREETNFTRGNMRIANNDNLEEVKAFYTDLTNDDALKNYISNVDVDQLNNSYDKLKDILFKDSVESKDFLGTSYAYKGIYVYTLIADIHNEKEDKEKNKYYLIGVEVENDNIIKNKKSNYECTCTILAVLTYSKETGLNIDFRKAGKYSEKKFDYITIHQGLLDKLYEDFGIKGSKTEDAEKIKLTYNLYQMFAKAQDEDFQDLNEFLPGLIIHSGRSKPGENDMPQHLPFIQYAALEHSVMDCKYSLIELLDFARYEK